MIRHRILKVDGEIIADAAEQACYGGELEPTADLIPLRSSVKLLLGAVLPRYGGLAWSVVHRAWARQHVF